MTISANKRTEFLIPHYVDDVNCVGEVRDSLVKTNGLALFIYGEFSSIRTVKQALDSGYSVAVIFGPMILPDHQDEIVLLKNKYKNKFKLYKLSTRPDDHATMIDNNLIYEETHKMGERYKYAFVILNASNDEIDYFKRLFIQDVSLACEITDPQNQLNTYEPMIVSQPA